MGIAGTKEENHFFWLVWHDKKLTWNNLQHRGIQGLRRCGLCGGTNEDNKHMFYDCPFSKLTLKLICNKFNFDLPEYDNPEDCFIWWIEKGKQYKVIPIIFHWNLWLCRNRWIFEEHVRTMDWIGNQVYLQWKNLNHHQQNMC